jgi:tetratricopeptide (TPR) repeat protein
MSATGSGSLYEADLKRLAVFLNTMQSGCLAIALCEDQALRNRLADDLRSRLSRGVREFTLSPDVQDPIALMWDAGVQPGDIVWFYGLGAAGVPALKHLEWRRESVWETGANLLFWVDGEERRLLLEEAPNFYSRRSVLVEFTAAAAPVRTLLIADITRSKRRHAAWGELFSKGLSLLADSGRLLSDCAGVRTAVAAYPFAATFADPAAAIRYAKGLGEVIRATGDDLWELRIVLDTGPVPSIRGEAVGAVVDRASRILQRANAWQVLLSSETYIGARDNVDGVRFFSHGLVSIEGFGPKSELYELLWGNGYPKALQGVPIPTNLPKRAEVFIGRGRQLHELASALTPAARVLLTGEPGVGKSTLALDAAHSALGARRFPGGVVWVSLESESSYDSVLSTLAQTFDLPSGSHPEEGRTAIELHCQGRPTLIVLDGARPATPPGLWEWLHSVPAALLVTSREPLPELQDAKLLKVEGLPEQEALALFTRRARLRHPNWSLSEEERPAFQRLLELTGGNPLALAIVAGMLGGNPLTSVVQAIEQRPVVDGEVRLDRYIEAAHARLTEPDHVLFAAASLFVDRLTVQAAEAVVGVRSAKASLEQLHRAGFLERTGTEPASYSVRPLLRAYASTKLAACADSATLRDRFIRHYAEVVVENNDVNDLSKLAVLDREWRNALAAAELASGSGTWSAVITLSEYLADFLALRGLWADLERLHVGALTAARASRDRLAEGRALNNLGIVHREQGQWAGAEAEFKQSLSISRKAGDRQAEGRTLNNLGIVFAAQDRLAEAESAFRQSLEIKRETGDRVGEAQTLNNLGSVYQALARWPEAEQAYQKSLEACRDIGDQLTQGRSLNNLGLTYAAQDRWTEAEGAFKQSLEIWRAYGDRLSAAATLNNLGMAYDVQGQRPEAERAYHQSLAIYREIGDRVHEGQTLQNLALLQADQGNRAAALALEREALAVLETTEAAAAIEKARCLIAEWEQRLSETSPTADRPAPPARPDSPPVTHD